MNIINEPKRQQENPKKRFYEDIPTPSPPLSPNRTSICTLSSSNPSFFDDLKAELIKHDYYFRKVRSDTGEIVFKKKQKKEKEKEKEKSMFMIPEGTDEIADEKDEKNQCKICFTNVQCCGPATCGHIFMCIGCTQKIAKKREGGKETIACPICKEPVGETGFIRVYIQ